MDNTQETITDIIAAKRREADFIVQNAEAYAKAGVTTAGTPYDDCDLEQDRDRADEIRKEADRLEAALKREVDKLNSAIQATVGRSDAEIDRLRREIAELKRAGNVANLREAAEKTRSTLEEALQILNGISDEEAGRLNARLEDVADAICEVTQWIIPDALAAPPRNCDTFGGDIKMLHTAWFDWTGSPSGQNPDGTVKLTFAEWLLEKAVRHA